MGNTTDPKAFMKWQYWGGWGYKRHVLKAIAEIENSDLKGQLQFHLYKDPNITGRNEATLYKDAACSGEGIMVFSKLQEKKQPDADADTLKMFCEMTKSEMENLWNKGSSHLWTKFHIYWFWNTRGRIHSHGNVMGSL